jgi:hypothetical protein
MANNNNKPASKQYIEIADKNNKIKVEINTFFEKALKEISKTHPEALAEIQKKIDEVMKAEKERKESEHPKIGEIFKDNCGRSYVIMGKNMLSEQPVATLRKGTIQYKVKIKDLYEKDGSRKTLTEDLLEEQEVDILF